MKKVSFILYTLLSIPIAAFGYDAKINGIYYDFLGNEAVVTHSNSSVTTSDYSGTILIPSSVSYCGKIYSVTTIGSSAFGGCSGLTSVTIPESVTTISLYAFSGCNGLTSVTIPTSVTYIGGCAFESCGKLKKVIVPDITAWCNIRFVDKYANPLYYAHHLFSNEETEITNLVVPESITEIGYYAFSGCSGLASVIIPQSVTTISYYAFSGCSGLTSVTIPESLTSIGSYAFSGCSGLTSVTIPESLTSIGSYAFSGCNGLTSVVIPKSVTSIADYVFSGCNGLTSVTIPESVTSIGSYAFKDCSGLISVTIPESVNSIGSDAFLGCNGLQSVTLNNNTLVSASRTTSTSMESIFGSQVEEYVIGDAVSRIGGYAFSNCTNLESVTISNSVTRIDNSAFSECSSLSDITIPNGVISIGSSAFQGCTNLESVTISNSVTDIGNYAFYGCGRLKKVIVPDIAAWCNIWFFDYYSNPLSYAQHLYSDDKTEITSLVIPNCVTSIGEYAFSGCCDLTSINIPDNVTNIYYKAFYGCSGLTSVTLNSNAIVSANRTSSTSMKTVFGGQVTEYVIGDSVKSIGSSAFYGCNSLTSVTIPNSVTSIGDSAFEGCRGLTSINIPNSVTSIGSGAFEGCSGLTSVTIPNSVTSVGSYAFSGCSGLNNITISDKVTSMGAYAFSGCNNAKLYVNRGTDGLLSVWNYGTDPYEVGTSQILPRPSVTVTSTTQTTIKYHINNIYPELEYNCNYDNVVGDNEYLINGLRPDYNHSVNLVVKSANNTYNTTAYSTTLPITPMVISSNVTASSISASGDYIQGDAKVISTLLTVDGKEITGVSGAIHGLEPNTSYNCSYMVVVEYGEGDTYTYADSKSIRTADLTLTTQQPKVISEGNVIVAAQSNLDDEETNVGFEWRRTDWTDEFASNYCTAYLYEGTMEGYIRNLYKEKLWKYRPFYQSDSGNRYYGEWVGIDPTNTSNFEPTVHTYATINVQGNSAEVKGYAMRGTDNVTSQGFMYWKNTSSYSLRKKAASIPADAVTVIASGNVMTATFEDLDYDTEYCYVAFVTTSENETFYGEEQTFKTGTASQDVIDGIEEVDNAQSSMVNVQSIYDLNGRKLSSPQKGINIIRYSDGTTRKVMIK